MYSDRQQQDINLIKLFVETHNRVPTYHENKLNPDFPNGAHFRKSFGTLNKTIIAAGLDPSVPTGEDGKAIGTEEQHTCANCAVVFALSGQKLQDAKASAKKYNHNRFYCSKSCATTFANKQRGSRSEQTKQKIKDTHASSLRGLYQGPFSKVYFNTCAICEANTSTKVYTTRCSEHPFKTAYNPNRTAYLFTFDITKYPDLFDLSLIVSIGWYNPKIGSKDGLTRDHRVSVRDAITNNYDKYYIKHPVNCRLMLHSTNSSKKDKSSISYDQLVIEVDNYDTLRLRG